MGNANDSYPDTTWEGDPLAPWNRPEPEFDEDGVEMLDEEDDGWDQPDGFELTDVEKLAVAQALFKAVGAVVGTQDPSNLRGRVDAHFEAMWDEMRAAGVSPKSFDINVMGEKVGTYSITSHDARSAETRMELRAENKRELAVWAAENGFAKVDMGKVQAYFDDTGEVPPGCAAIPVAYPERKAGIDRTTLRIDPEKVAGRLGGTIVGREAVKLLEGGE